MRVAVLAGGVGGARLCDGLYRLGESRPDLNIIVNTGDDFELHGLSISPDLDTVLYTLAGWADPIQGWGLKGDTWTCAEQLSQLKGQTWFRLGDKDLATHLYRTQRLREGASLTEVTSELSRNAGLPAGLLMPMCDHPVQTKVRVAQGWIDFQEYFVHRQGLDAVLELRYEGADATPPSPTVTSALSQASRIVLAPSNPFLSLLPILSLQTMLHLWPQTGVRRVAVSPMLGQQAVKGPLAAILLSLGYPVSSLGIAQVLRPWIDVLIIDEADAVLKDSIEALGLEVVLAPTLMRDTDDRRRLARLTLEV